MLSEKLGFSAYCLLIATALVVSACGGTATPAALTQPPATIAPATMAAPVVLPTATLTVSPTPVEIFSWWVGPGEADGLAAMVKLFIHEYPQYTIVNAAVAGGGGTNAQAVLATRLAAGDPPDSWQAHAGQETIGTYVAGNEVKPLDGFFASTGFGKAIPTTLLPLISKEGHPYSVPVDIHRSNVMWYNPKVLAAAKVTIPFGGFSNWNDFFAACDKIKATGKVCLSLGPEGFTVMHLFENVMIGTMGAAKWNGLWTSPPSTQWTGADVKAGIANFRKALSYTNTDAMTLSDWQPASKMVSDGNAAFNIMGDWAEVYFANPAPNGLALKPQIDFDWTPTPGTQGIFVFLSDSFVLPIGNKNPNGTMAWLSLAASKAGQEAFNPLKGSICARTDCNPALFSEYSQEAMKDWATDSVVGSLTHGVVANNNWKAAIDTALKLYLTDPSETDQFQAALAAACKSAGTCR